VKLLLARRPNRLDAAHPRIIEDLLDMLIEDGQMAVDSAIEMLTSLYQEGTQSRFARKLQGLPLWELKTSSRGGVKGGARVYFFVSSFGNAIAVNAEVKIDSSPSQSKVAEALAIFKAYNQGIAVVPKESNDQSN
jgi:hypothetical protein